MAGAAKHCLHDVSVKWLIPDDINRAMPIAMSFCGANFSHCLFLAPVTAVTAKN